MLFLAQKRTIVFKSTFLFLFFCLTFGSLAAQNGVLAGSVRDKNTQEALIGVSIRVQGTDAGASSDAEGNFRIGNLPPGSYNVTASYIGYNPETRFNVLVTNGNASFLNFEMSDGGAALAEVTISENRSVRVASVETPLSIQSVSLEEIRSNPGGNFDISKVLTALPGVGAAQGGGGPRNDLIIRGGGPSENVYYLDGVEIPVINHFATQGAAGGPQGILNVSFIEDASLASSAFHARYDNALSSVLQFRQRDGNPERVQGNFRLSGTEVALTTEGPLSKKTTFLASARRSYLQLLFQAIGLPIRPNYWDFQYKITHKFNAKTTLTSLGVGAIDEFSFAPPEEATAENLYIISSNPIINQWNYTQGFTLKRLIDNGFWNVTLSRNMFDNQLDQFRDNLDGQQNDESKRILDLQSQEIENKLRFDLNQYLGDWKYSFGGMLQYVQYYNRTEAQVRPELRDSAGNLLQAAITSRFLTDIGFFRYGAFGQVSRSLMRERLAISFGLRADGNTFGANGNRLDQTISPRLSATYALSDRWKLNGSLGRYYKIAPYTVLGFRDNDGRLVNRDVPYTRVDHYVAGVEYLPTPTLRLTAEGFYKNYGDYLVSAASGVSLANLGTEFGVLGNERVLGTGTGRVYGMELFAQQKLNRRLFYIVSYTLFWSKFAGADGREVRSAWDTRHLVSLTGGYKFPKNWELGLRWRFQGGSPFTPYDLEASQRNFLALGRGVLDNNRLNQGTLVPLSQADIRIDKKWNFRRTTFDLFLDVTNFLAQTSQGTPTFLFQRTADNTGFATTDGQALRADGSNAIPVVLDNKEVSVLPTIGFIFEF
jgi:hypothetical protein